MLTSVLFILLILNFQEALAVCPNLCSGHGACGISNVCECYDGWNAGAADCSQSMYDFWVLKVVATNDICNAFYCCRRMSKWYCLG